jgi:hypothetical protein
MAHSDWIGGATNANGMAYNTNLWASYWHNLFPTNDHRNQLSWEYRYTDLQNAQVYNFYSSGEEVCRTYTVRPTPGLTGYVGNQLWQVLWQNVPASSYTWCLQELQKGRMTVNILGSEYGGWGFNYFDGYLPSYPTWYEVDQPCNCTRRIKTPAEIGTITTNLLNGSQFNPLFKTGWGGYELNNPSNVVVITDSQYFTGPSWILGLYQSGSGDAIAADPLKRARLLADAVPALTLPLGANPITTPGIIAQSIDMMTLENNWPQGRLSNAQERNNWHHSDFHEVAYTFTHELFDTFVDLGNLK